MRGRPTSLWLHLLVLGLGLFGGRASAYVLKRDDAGNPVRWTRPLRISVPASLPEALGEPRTMEALEAAVRSYAETLPGLAPSVVPASSPSPAGDDVPNVTIGIAKRWPYGKDVAAVTAVTLAPGTDEIVQAHIALNPHRRFRVLDGADPSGASDLQSTLTHELGHALGLAHNDTDRDAVMFPFAAPGDTSKRWLAEDDYAGLSALYPGEAVVPHGCSVSPRDPSLLLALLGLGLLGRRRQWGRAGLPFPR
jgi:MYXO-CTERM domain-containing protein